MIASKHQPALQVRGVSKAFQHASRSHTVLDGVSMDIREGEFVTILGPSGCGKSTLLNIIAGLDSPDSGSIAVKGERKNHTGPDRIVIFQEGALFPWLTVIENIEFGLRLAGVSKEKRRQEAGRLVDMVQLSKFADSYIHHLSGGMKQRVAIARALAMDPGVLLMDEPFAALDMQTRDMLHGELLQIHHATKKTILFVTHNINEALLLGDRVVVLSAGTGGVAKEFAICSPRPRDIDRPEIAAIKRQILQELEKDFQFARREAAGKE